MTLATDDSSGRVQLAAAVDLGSNSFHMIVGRLEGGQLNIVDKLRERVRFAAGLDGERSIMPEAEERALGCLRRFGQRIGGIRVVGTNTLRQASNASAFMKRAQEALGYPIEIISGREEARLIYLGVAQCMASERGRRLVIDIGGGSTEFIIGDDFDILEADSLYMGCVSFSQRYFPEGQITAKGFREALLNAELELQSIARPYQKLGWSQAVGCSGTIHAVDAIVRQNGWSDEGITFRSLKRLRKALVTAGQVDTLSLAGLQADRKPVIAGGVAILEAIFQALRVERIVPSPGALREGVLYDLVGRIRHEDVRDRTIAWFQEHYRVDKEQAGRVEETALRLLDNVAGVWSLDETWAGRLLAWAARLREIGLAISHTGYHKHGAYLITHSHMAGFSRGEQRILAALVVAQRRKLHAGILQGVDVRLSEAVKKLCVLFRLAIRLNRSRDSELPRCVLKVKKERLKLVFGDSWLRDRPLTQAALEQEAKYLGGFGFSLGLKVVQ